MQGVLTETIYKIESNLTIGECLFLLVLFGITMRVKKICPKIQIVYSVFLILYITIFRRATIYDNDIQWKIRIFPDFDTFIGNVLNIALFVPLGFAARTCFGKGKLKNICYTVFGLSLSFFCEIIQYFTNRGWAETNDVLYNTLDTILGVWVVDKILRSMVQTHMLKHIRVWKEDK